MVVYKLCFVSDLEVQRASNQEPIAAEEAKSLSTDGTNVINRPNAGAQWCFLRDQIFHPKRMIQEAVWKRLDIYGTVVPYQVQWAVFSRSNGPSFDMLNVERIDMIAGLFCDKPENIIEIIKQRSR